MQPASKLLSTPPGQPLLPNSPLGAPQPGGRGGFEGAVSNLGLTDVIQLESQSRFSGSISVAHLDQEGHLFFEDGEIVHAEVGSFGGEDAVQRILAWPGGEFRLQENVRSLGRTIHKRLDHLLLDAHRWLDEEKRVRAPEPPRKNAADPQVKEIRTMTTISQIARGIQGVSDAVLMAEDGTVLAAEGPSRDSLVARTIYLTSMIAAPIGEAFDLGDLQFVCVHSTREQLLLFHSKNKNLAAYVEPGASVDVAEMGIRKAIALGHPEA